MWNNVFKWKIFEQNAAIYNIIVVITLCRTANEKQCKMIPTTTVLLPRNTYLMFQNHIVTAYLLLIINNKTEPHWVYTHTKQFSITKEGPPQRIIG